MVPPSKNKTVKEASQVNGREIPGLHSWGPGSKSLLHPISKVWRSGTSQIREEGMRDVRLKGLATSSSHGLGCLCSPATSTLLNAVFLFGDANTHIALCNDFKSVIPSDSHSSSVDVGLLLISSPLTECANEAEKLVRWPPRAQSLSRVRLFVTPWTIALPAPPFMQVSGQECWSELPFPPPGDLLRLN